MRARAALAENFGSTAGQVSEARLSQVLSRFDHLFDDGAQPPSREVLLKLADELLGSDSRLFADPQLWQFLTDDVLPKLVATSLATGRTLKMVCLGCGAGHEVFSLAIKVLEEFTARSQGAPVAIEHARIVGYDVSPRRIGEAQRAEIESSSVQRSARPQWARGWVRSEPGHPGYYRLHPAVASLCRFEQANLLALVASERMRLSGAQLVLCQQVLGDFEPTMARHTIYLLADALPPGAMLVVAPHEAELLAASPKLKPLQYLGAAVVAPQTVAAS